MFNCSKVKFSDNVKEARAWPVLLVNAKLRSTNDLHSQGVELADKSLVLRQDLELKSLDHKTSVKVQS